MRSRTFGDSGAETSCANAGCTVTWVITGGAATPRIRLDWARTAGAAANSARIVSSETGLPAKFSKTENVVWRLPVPGQVGAGPHGVDAGQATDVARQDPAEGEDEAGRGHEAPVGPGGGVGRVAPQRVVVADAVGVVPHIVAGDLVAPRLDGVGDRHPDEPPQVVERVVGDDGEAPPVVSGVDVHRLPVRRHLPLPLVTPSDTVAPKIVSSETVS